MEGPSGTEAMGGGPAAKPAELRKAEKRIIMAGFAGCSLALLTVFQFIFPFNAGLSPAVVAAGILQTVSESRGNPDVLILGLSPSLVFSVIFFAVVAAATIGVFKKNKIFSVILFCYAIMAFVFSLSTATGTAIIAIVVLVTVLVFLFYGLLGTFDYHQYVDKAAQNAKES